MLSQHSSRPSVIQAMIEDMTTKETSDDVAESGLGRKREILEIFKWKLSSLTCSLTLQCFHAPRYHVNVNLQ
jgi:hypothetical protein